MKKNSVRAAVIISCFMIAALILVLIVFSNFFRWYNESKAAEVLNSWCRANAAQLNFYFDEDEKVGEAAAYIMRSGIASAEDPFDTEVHENIAGQVRDQLGGSIKNLHNISSFSVFFEDQDGKSVSGRSYMLKDDGTIEAKVPERTDWYDTAAGTSDAFWTDPYSDSDDQGTLNYVFPVYSDDKFIGAFSLSLNFDELVGELTELKTQDNAKAFLDDPDNNVRYIYKNSKASAKSTDSFRFTKNGYLLTEESTEGNVIFYSIGKENYCMAFDTLNNGMHFVLSNIYKDFKGSQETLTGRFIIILFFLFILVVIASFSTLISIYKPLDDITKAADSIASGIIEGEVPKQKENVLELKGLADSLETIRQNIKKDKEGLEQLSYKDPLTNVKNRTAYQNEAARIQKKIEAGEDLSFAIVITDINGLGNINQTAGYEEGNKSIVNSCRLMCSVFSHSPVFRIGGDEFVSIISGEDYDNRYELIKRFDEFNTANEDNKNDPGKKPSECITVCFAMSDYQKGNDKIFDEVFNRVYKKLYENKRKQEDADA